MERDLLEQYEAVCGQIELEKQDNMDRLLSSLVSVMLKDQGETPDPSKREGGRRRDQHEVNMLALLALRTAINCRMISSGYDKKRSQMEEDIEDVIERVRSIEGDWRRTETTKRDALDILSALCPEEDNLKNYFFCNYGVESERKEAITPELFFLFYDVADYFEKNQQIQLSLRVLEYLCKISLERNDIRLHQEIVVRVLLRIGDRAPEAIRRIGADNIQCFEQSFDEYAGDFFWFYADALCQTDQFSESRRCYEKCYLIRKNIYGENSWYTDLAKRDYLMSSCIISGKPCYEEKFLHQFICNIENGLYPDVDENTLSILEGKTLYMILNDCSSVRDHETYKVYLRRYEEICERYNDSSEPSLKVRLAKNLRGRYLFAQGDFIQAEAAFLDALNTEMPDIEKEIITKAQVKSNLLLVYYVQYDLEMAVPLLMELLETIEAEETQSGLTEKDEYRIYTILIGLEMQTLTEIDTMHIEEMKVFLHETCSSLLQESFDLTKDLTSEMVVFTICAIEQILQTGNADNEELHLYFDAVCKMAGGMQQLRLDAVQTGTLNLVAALLAQVLGKSSSKYFFKESLRIVKQEEVPLSVKIAVLEFAAMYFEETGDRHFSSQCLETAFSLIAEGWQSFVKYANDARLVQILTPMQIVFFGCYSVLRESAETEAVYEKVLQFKELASLAGKERNIILNQSFEDSKLLRQIKKQQDKIAVLEAGKMFGNRMGDYEKEKQRLRALETEFARKFPHMDESAFTRITWEGVKRAIPDHAAVIEYVYFSSVYGKRIFMREGKQGSTGFDVYVIQKRNGTCRLEHVVLENGEEIINDAEEFVSILQSGVEDVRTDEIRGRLFQSLIRPVLKYLNGFSKVYIAPDSSLSNLPFELLYDEEQERLEDAYRIVKIECARDFLYGSRRSAVGNGNLIIGNPQYQLRDREVGKEEKSVPEQQRKLNLDARQIRPLPFSEIEVQKIGEICNSIYYTGFAASKQLLLSAEGYRNIHIATHGYFDLSDTGVPALYSSCLLFAGVCNWMEKGEAGVPYGNGIITADEVSRLDLSSAELVVLSSCLSGMNDLIINKGFHGMVGAMSAAGVHYVISHLWEADDFSTAILMDAFYYQYVVEKQSPPAALSFAKAYLRKVTVGELRRRHWFDIVRKGNVTQEVREGIARYEAMPDRVRPFKNETYWGGFFCCLCN